MSGLLNWLPKSTKEPVLYRPDYSTPQPASLWCTACEKGFQVDLRDGMGCPGCIAKMAKKKRKTKKRAKK